MESFATITNSAMNTLFDCLLTPFSKVSPWPGMIAVSFISTVIVLYVFKYTTNQDRVKQNKNRLLATTLELALFRNDPVANLDSFYRVLIANFHYLRELMKPLLITILPIMLIMSQVYCWFGGRPVRPSENFIVTASLKKDFPVMEQIISIEKSESVTAETDAMRAPSLNQVSWRLKAVNDINNCINLNINGTTISKNITIDTKTARSSARRVSPEFWAQITYPSEPPLPVDCPLNYIEITYLPAELILLGIRFNWLFTFIILTLLFGLLLKKPIGVEI